MIVMMMMMMIFSDYTCAETCQAAADCQNTKCDAAHDLECHRGQCTCVNHASSKLFVWATILKSTDIRKNRGNMRKCSGSSFGSLSECFHSFKGYLLRVRNTIFVSVLVVFYL